ncbi:MAG: DUF2628 domain-containing protein [Burkholderiales bacterium]
MSSLNPFAPPKAEVDERTFAAHSAEIASLPVSQSWKNRFRLIEQAGAVKQTRFKELSAGERMQMSFNILAFLFGPIYYAFKGMWKKGIALFAVCLVAILVLSVVLDFAGLGRFADGLGYVTAAVFSLRANIDYYKKWVLGENGWW